MMSKKEVITRAQASGSIREAVELMGSTVGITLGPKGRSVLLSTDSGSVHITKDGLSVVNVFSLPDPVQNMIVQIFKEIVQAMPGDGTTTATVIAKTIYLSGSKMAAAGCSVAKIKQGVDLAIKLAIDKLREASIPVDTHEKLVQVATVSANNDPLIGKIIAEAFKQVGVDGKITIREGKSVDMSMPEIKHGVFFDRGYISAYFVNEPKGKQVILENVYILLYDKKFTKAKSVVEVLNTMKGESLLIIAEDVDGEALTTLVLNKMHGMVNVVAVKAPGYGDSKNAMLQDIAIATGSTIVSQDCGMNIEEFDKVWLGKASRVVVSKDNTIIVEGDGEPEQIKKRVQLLNDEIKNASSKYEKEQLQERLARLCGGIANINVGGYTEVEIKEKKDRIEDAQHATKEALLGGVLPGGGSAFLSLIPELKKLMLAQYEDDIRSGVKLVSDAIQAPTRVIAENAGQDGDVIVGKILSADDPLYGYNVLSDKVENLIESGIVDPTNVVISAINNAFSCATLLLQTEAIIINAKD